ncbi:D-hydantoinase [Oceanobacillus oncorhynchi subsp. incaldanensis]|uniref:Dihydropyrimidinase n=1 Tax=Oceanobacillus aidingensis TaxID=645964 RepID=A0ABV9JWC0_9BACI|nr:dihydropyrimidinase [Oceanobacillus oncorhynchi]UUI40953.1 dihydropyrimidinase [Oceanobacillus oncorhynchi]GIO18826.1 D-hydantoinase [Oceanobacillus oncorhynchi subsp. incaldanensis]
MKKIIKNGTIVTAADIYQADVLIEDEKVKAIGQDLSDVYAEVIDATGLYVFPGGIDPHTHMEMPFGGTVTKDDYESGTIAAAHGGTTTIIDFCLTEKGKTLKNALEIWHAKSEGRAVIDYGFHLQIVEANEQILQEIPAVIEEEGVTSFKVFMAYKNVLQADDETLFQTLVTARDHGGLVMVHAENGDVIEHLTQEALKAGNTDPIYHALTRPPELEGEATGRAAKLTALADSQLYVVHVTCKEAVEQIAEARSKGFSVYGETCPQYLVLDQTYLEKPDFEGAKYVWSPPLRDKSNQEVLWNALKSGELQTIGSDHCAFDFDGQKDLGKGDFTKIPNGGPFVEDRFSILFSEGVKKGRISMNQFVDMVSTQAAKLFGLFPQKGTIAPGTDADIVLFDPNVERTISAGTHHSAVDYSALEGMKVTGQPVTVLSRGEYVIKDKELVAKPGAGKFLKRAKFDSAHTNKQETAPRS